MLPPAASEGGQKLAVPLWILQVLQGDHVGQAQLAVKAKSSLAAPDQKAEDAEEEEEEEGDGCYDNIGDGCCADDGLT